MKHRPGFFVSPKFNDPINLPGDLCFFTYDDGSSLVELIVCAHDSYVCVRLMGMRDEVPTLDVLT